MGPSRLGGSGNLLSRLAQGGFMNFRWLGACGFLLASACVLSPFHGQEIATRNTSVDFELWSLNANATMTVECAAGHDVTGNPYQQIFSFVSSGSPITLNGERVYFAGGDRVLPSHCWGIFHGRWTTRLRFKQGTYNVRVYTEDGVQCQYDKIFDEQKTPTVASNECAMTYSNTGNYANYIYFYAAN